MFAIVYKFTPKSGQETAFLEIWKTVTAGIIKYRGGLGSRLHKSEVLYEMDVIEDLLVK